MATSKKQTVSLFVDRLNQQWIVRDPGGKFWSIPFTDACWDNRQPFEPTAETDLEPVPGHYTYMLGLPFWPKEKTL